ncbi:HAD-like protein, partial [Metschnikowia bicuspidata var. bicuspidata NRRL YB-4993]
MLPTLLRATKTIVSRSGVTVGASRSASVGVSFTSTVPISKRFYSDKKASEKADDKPQSILNEDMLSRAGFEEAEKEKSSEEETEGKKDDTDRSARRRRRAQTSKDRQREKYANWFYTATLFGGFAGLGFLCRDWDSEDEQKAVEGQGIENGFTPQLMYGRLNKRVSSLFTFFSEPAFENLLPPPPPEAYRRPLTLVLTLDDLLVHSSWDAKNGWRTAKRPGLDYFLGYLSQYYEIVIFGSEYQMYSEKTVAKLDPLRAYIQYALFREACRYKDGKLIKDLNLLNRDLANTIAIDVNEETLVLNPENAITLKPWDGKPDDTLVKLIPLLEYLATQPVKDVRPILSSFTDKSSIVEEYSAREAKLRQKWMEDNKHLLERAHKPNAGSFIASLMGIPQSSVNKQPKMPLDIIREHGQLQYESLQRYLKENEAKFLEEEKKMKEEYGKVTLNKLMTEGMPNPEDIAKAQAEKA